MYSRLRPPPPKKQQAQQAMATRFLQRASRTALPVNFIRPFAAPALLNSAQSKAMPLNVAGQRAMATTITVEKPDSTIIFPRENPADGLSYELNWSLCGSGVIPQGKSFRNLKAQELAKAGGPKKSDAPQVVPWTTALEQEVVNYLGSEKIIRYVQDSALGTLLKSEIYVRLVSDSAAAVSDFKTLMASAKLGKLGRFKENVTVLQAVNYTAKGAFISFNAKTKTVLMGGTSNLEKLLDTLPQASTEAFLERGTLPLWGSLVADSMIVSKGFDTKATIKYGCAFGSEGFCRMFMGSISEGAVKDEFKSFPNSLPLPKGVVLFANDVTGALPGASKLTAAQAAYFYVSAVVPPPGLSSWVKAANLVLELGAKTPIYLINRGAFASATEADEAALAVVGKSGSPGVLGLEVIDTGKETKKASGDDTAKAAKSWQMSVEARCKGVDAVLAGAPKV